MLIVLPSSSFRHQIVSSICELVECYGPDIRSGWRPLFAALRAVRLDGIGISRVLSDVFRAFFLTENAQVMASAILDCILCLLKHVQIQLIGPDQSENSETPWSKEDSFSALVYLKRCSDMLASFHSMNPAPPVFHSSHR
jgi:brefeldin A-inhibited guanine nucleotide-exchange protein 3